MHKKMLKANKARIISMRTPELVSSEVVATELLVPLVATLVWPEEVVGLALVLVIVLVPEVVAV